MENLARADKILDRPQLHIHRGFILPLVDEQHLDPVRAQTRQRRLDRRGDVPPRQPAIIGARSHGPVALGRNDQLITFVRHEVAKDLFGAARLVGIRTIEEIDPRVTHGLVEFG